jgi:hypothetical protein
MVHVGIVITLNKTFKTTKNQSIQAYGFLKSKEKKSANQKSSDFFQMSVLFKKKRRVWIQNSIKKIYSLAYGFLFFVIFISGWTRLYIFK